MKLLASLFVLLCILGKNPVRAELIPNYYLLSDTVNDNLSPGEAKFSFHVGNPVGKNDQLKISVNGIWRKVTLDETNSFEVTVEPGAYQFEFLLDQEHYEITTSNLEIESKHVETFQLTFGFLEEPNITVKKPVIYFHSTVDLPFEITVQPTADFVFTYPPAQGTWKGVSKLAGGVEIDHQVYPYLFWESEQQYTFASEGNGFKVGKTEVVPFLTKKLAELGLNQQEQTDFITFWGPKLADNETSFVQFSVDESCNAFATLNCSPAPDAVRRVYIQIAQWDAEFERYLNDVTFEPINKSAWYIVEWGGFEFNTTDL